MKKREKKRTQKKKQKTIEKKKERKTRKKGNSCKKKVWKRFGCLIFEHEIETFRGVFWERKSRIKSFI